MTPNFSIGIPTFDRPAALARCLAAVAQVDYPSDSLEVIVVDDGGRAELEPVIAASANGIPVRLERQERGGPARARNRGATVARGRYLAFTDDDCEPARDWLTALERPLSAGADAVAGRAQNAAPENLCARASQVQTDFLLGYYNRDPARAGFGTSNNLAIKRAELLAVGGFDEGFEHAAGEDRELVRRLCDRGRAVAYAPDASVRHSHRQDLLQFWKQRYGYGRSAALFRERVGQVRVEPLSFYTGIVRSVPSGSGRITLIGLLLLSQVANAAGFLHETVRMRRRR